MLFLPDPREEQVEHRRSENTLGWLTLVHKMLLSALGGAWPEQPITREYRRVLDVGCSSGYWLVRVAQSHPAIEKLYGVDQHPRLIARARTLAREQQVNERVEFHVMDALFMLEFPFDYLDLVSIQMGGCFLRTWEWLKLLQEFRRVARPEGIIRAVEHDFIGESSSPAFNRLMQLLMQTYYQAGHFFAPKHDGLLRELPRLFDQFGVRNVQTRSYQVELRADTPDWQDFARCIPPVMTPFVAKWGRLPEDYEELCRQAMDEIARPDFAAIWKLLVVWGTK